MIVTNQTELLSALGSQDAQIQIADNISLNTSIFINYAVTISSISSDTIYTITKDASFYSYLIRVGTNGVLTLQNIILDGNRENHSMENDSNRSLIFLAGGSLYVGSGTTIQNNYTYMEGGGIYVSGDASYANTLVMENDAQVVNCSSRTTGGGIMVALRNNQDAITISGNVLLSQNSASNGGGLYLRSYLEGIGMPFSIGENVRIVNNTATGNGGGIYVSSYAGGGSPAVPLTLADSLLIQNNQAKHGAGLYYNGVNDGDGVRIEASVEISSNQATDNGGGIYIAASSGNLTFSAASCKIIQNQANAGGGIFFNNTVGCHLNLDSVTLQANRAVASSGGGMRIDCNATALQPCEIQIKDSMIVENQAGVHGGGIYIQATSPLRSCILQKSSITKNTAGQSGGGLLLNAGGNITITDSEIGQNTSGQFGGGLYIDNNQQTDSVIQMEAVSITSNSTAKNGGGLWLKASQGSLAATISNCSIEGNMAGENKI